MPRILICLTVVWAAATAAATPVTYNLAVSTTYEVDSSTAGIARAFGIPEISRTETSASFTLELLESGAYRLTFVTASQQTLAGEAVVPNVERVGDLLPGRWLEFAPWAMREGGVKRAPAFAKDSEEISYNLLALMLFTPGGPLTEIWRDGARAAVARSYGMSVISMESAEAQPLPAFEGEETERLDFSVVFTQKLSQSTKVSEMTGSASFEGVGAAVPGADGLPDYARLDITGKRDRSFFIAGKQRDLSDLISLSMRLVRGDRELPEGWGMVEELAAE